MQGQETKSFFKGGAFLGSTYCYAPCSPTPSCPSKTFSIHCHDHMFHVFRVVPSQLRWWVSLVWPCSPMLPFSSTICSFFRWFLYLSYSLQLSLLSSLKFHIYHISNPSGVFCLYLEIIVAFILFVYEFVFESYFITFHPLSFWTACCSSDQGQSGLRNVPCPKVRTIWRFFPLSVLKRE